MFDATPFCLLRFVALRQTIRRTTSGQHASFKVRVGGGLRRHTSLSSCLLSVHSPSILISAWHPLYRAVGFEVLGSCRIAKRLVLLIRDIGPLNKPHTLRLITLQPVPHSIISPAEIPITRNKDIHQTPIDQRTNYSSSIPRRIRPQLGCRDTTRTIPHEKHSIDESFLRIAADVARRQGHEDTELRTDH